MIKRVDIDEGESPILVARVTDYGGTPITTGLIIDVEIKLFCLSSATPAEELWVSTGNPGSAYYSDTLTHQYDNILGDTGGSNFVLVFSPQEYAMVGTNTYRLQVVTNTTAFTNVDRWDLVVGAVL